jgi:hypothetical protein
MIRLLILAAMFSSLSFAQISNQTVWEVRPTVGSDTNGGGFVPGSAGTDYSQQNAANSSGNNKSTTDAAASGTTTITSVTASFTAAIVGNLVYFAGGTGTITAQWRQVTAYTNATTITIDTLIATSVGMTMNIGGAFATVAAAYGATAGVAGNTFWIKNTGVYTVTSTLTLSTSSGGARSNGGAMEFLGYNSTRGDNGMVTWTTATNSVHLVTFTASSQGFVFENIQFTDTAGTPGGGFYVPNNQGHIANVLVANCLFTGFISGIYAPDTSNPNDFTGIVVQNTEIRNSTNDGVINGAGGSFVNVYIHNNGNDGIKLASPGVPGVTIVGSIISANFFNGVETLLENSLDPLIVIDSDIVNNGNAGIYYSNYNNGVLLVQNSIIDSNSNYGIYSALTIGGGCTSCNLLNFIGINNAFRNNAPGNYANLSPESTDIALTADPFVSRATGNFALNNTSGGGAACRGAGFPGVLGAGGTGYIDVGALQSQAAGSSGPVGFVIQ